MYQTTKLQDWKDETGTCIPISRITKAEKVRERLAHKLLNEALKVQDQLTAYKELIAKLSEEAYEATMEELKNNKESKGNFRWFNFDRSIKIEVKISERIDFDDLTIKACKDKLDEFLDDEVVSKTEFVKEMILKAFQKTGGRLDSKKVMPLLRYKDRIKSPVYQEAMRLLEQSVRRPYSKTYFRIWQRDEQGEYQSIDLNISSI